MLALLVFGSELERQLGRWRFLVLYLLSALGGAAAIQLFGDPGGPSPAPPRRSTGCSGPSAC